MLKEIKKHRGGIIALPMVIFLTVIIVAITVGLGAVSYNENVNSFGVSKSATALSYALTGARDALERIARNSAFSEITWTDATDASNGSYKIKIDSSDCASNLDGCARIKVNYTANKSPTIITSEGVSGNYKRKIQIDALVDANGVIASTTAVEIKSLPTASTAQVSPVAQTTATLNGWTNPNGVSITAWFRYGQTLPSQCSDTFSGGTSTTPQTINPGAPSNMFPISFSQGLTGLSASTTYYYCAIASDGTTVYGNVFAFTTTS